MKVLVYHDRVFVGMDTEEITEEKAYDLVGEFTTGIRSMATGIRSQVEEILDEAFQKTNSIEQHWSLNQGVRSFHGKQVRSTSVGDVVKIEGLGFWVVEMCGFRKLLEREEMIVRSQPGGWLDEVQGRKRNEWNLTYNLTYIIKRIG